MGREKSDDKLTKGIQDYVKARNNDDAEGVSKALHTIMEGYMGTRCERYNTNQPPSDRQ